jgi:hypothetical protein
MAAMIQNQFGERSPAVASLKKALDRGYSAAEIRAAPEFDNLRDSPDFQKVVPSK